MAYHADVFGSPFFVSKDGRNQSEGEIRQVARATAAFSSAWKTGLAAAAFPKRNLIIIALLLSGFGAFIEFVQGLPMVHRDRDAWDWVADTIAIVAALSPMVLVWWRGIARSALAAPRGTPPGGWPPGQKNIDM